MYINHSPPPPLVTFRFKWLINNVSFKVNDRNDVLVQSTLQLVYPLFKSVWLPVKVDSGQT